MASRNSLFLSRRAYTVASENIARVQSSVSSMMKAAAMESSSTKVKEQQVFWMRDPKTGNFIPESHFDEIDVAELRNKILSKKTKTIAS